MLAKDLSKTSLNRKQPNQYGLYETRRTGWL